MRQKIACLKLFLSATLGLALLSLLPFGLRAAGLPEKLRVLSIDLQNAKLQSPGTPGDQLAQELQKLLEKTDPDIICLQGATDWENCDMICKLKRGLRVLTCSAFTGKSGADAMPQVAILARDRAVLSWVEEISEGQGFAFAVLQAGARKLGVFSLQSPRNSPATTAAAERVLAEVKKLQAFPQNRPDAFLIARTGPIKTTPFVDNTFQTVTAEGPPGVVRNEAEFWAWNAAFLSRPRLVPVSGIRIPTAVCDVDSANSSPSKFAYQSTLIFAGETAASVQALFNPPVAAPQQKPALALWQISIGGGVLLLGLVLLFSRRSPKVGMELVPLGSGGEVVKAGPGDDPVRSNLLAWIKTHFVQRLLSDRQRMISNEDEATQRTLVIEEKISRLQTALQSRISAYESRIERLEHELTAAAFENRDLIRSQIDLLKEKVAKAKEEQSFRRN